MYVLEAERIGKSRIILTACILIDKNCHTISDIMYLYQVELKMNGRYVRAVY